MTSPNNLSVFIVDDDARMGAAMQRLLKTVGLYSESLASPQTFYGESFQALPLASYWMCDFPE